MGVPPLLCGSTRSTVQQSVQLPIFKLLPSGQSPSTTEPRYLGVRSYTSIIRYIKFVTNAQ